MIKELIIGGRKRVQFIGGKLNWR